MNNYTITQLLKDHISLKGKELAQVIESNMNGEVGNDEDKRLAQQCYDDYWGAASNTKPTEEAFYYIWDNRNGAIRLTRDGDLSPKTANFLKIKEDGDYGEDEVYENVNNVDLQKLIAYQIAINGKDLKQLCDEIIDGSIEVSNYKEYQMQLATELISRFYSMTTKEPKDTIYYKVRIHSAGVPQVLRDLEKSPRYQKQEDK
jgi:hypothetical protein